MTRKPSSAPWQATPLTSLHGSSLLARKGAVWHVGDLAGAPGESLAVNLAGAYAGHYCDWSSDERGDSIALAMAVRGLDYKGVKGLLRERYGIAAPLASSARYHEARVFL